MSKGKKTVLTVKSEPIKNTKNYLTDSNDYLQTTLNFNERKYLLNYIYGKKPANNHNYMSFQQLKEKLLAINPPLNQVEEVVKLILAYAKEELILNEEETI